MVLLDRYTSLCVWKKKKKKKKKMKNNRYKVCMFANDLRDQGSIPSRGHTKDSKNGT